jgi:flagellar biosynthesis/type III secretory pathway protein FliH
MSENDILNYLLKQNPTRTDIEELIAEIRRLRALIDEAPDEDPGYDQGWNDGYKEGIEEGLYRAAHGDR